MIPKKEKVIREFKKLLKEIRGLNRVEQIKKINGFWVSKLSQFYQAGREDEREEIKETKEKIAEKVRGMKKVGTG